MSSRVTIDSTSASLLHSTSNTVHPAALDTLTFTNYSPRKIQACLDSTIMTYLQQQQQQQPPPLPPQALSNQQQLKSQRMYQQKQQHYHNQIQQLQGRPPAAQENHKYQLENTGTMHYQSAQNHEAPDMQQTSVYQAIHPGAHARISTPHSLRDQTREEEPTAMPSHMKDLVKHDQAISTRAKQLRAQSIQDEEEDDDSNDDDDYYDDENSEYSDDAIDDSEIEDVDSISEYESDSDQTETGQPLHDHSRTRSSEVHRNTMSSNKATVNGESQYVQQVSVRQPTTDIGARGMDGSNGALHHSPADKLSEADNHTSPVSPRTCDNGRGHPLAGQELLTSLPPKDSTSSQAHQLTKARMVPYVDEEDEDEDEDEEDEDEEYEEDYDEVSEEYDEDEEEEEDDFSYSDEDGEEDDEEENSLTEYDAREDPRRVSGKSRAGQSGQHPHSVFYHYRPPRLDVNYLQKRAITKQVVRRSSLTALLGEVSQPEIESRNFTVRSSGGQLGHYQRHSTMANRRPTLTGIWPEPVPSNRALAAPNASEIRPRISQDTVTDAQVKPMPNSTSIALADQHRRSVLENTAAILTKAQVLQEPHRPRRTDSGIEVKLSPHQHRGSGSSDSSSEDKRPHQLAGNPTIESITASSPQRQSTVESSSSPLTAPGSLSCSRNKSEGDNPSQAPSSAGLIVNNSERSSSANGPNVPQVPKPLKSSISCHTFPRAAGKRVGQKHVSWHHSLFPVERVLRVKPSLPSLSCVAIESANATLSQLPSIPVMTKDKVESFHQSIRSLRTLSRIEIAKMSYKQQGRQELTSQVPISKSPHDPMPWWNPARWLKGPVVIDKRHWKPDNSRESCAYCFTPFHRFTNPRHHCRKCGDIFCGKCASAEILMDAKNCVYVQQSQLARWSRRVDLQRHSLWIDTLPQLHPVRTAAESALVAGSSADGHGSVGHAGGINNGMGAIGGVSMGHRSSSGSGSGSSRRGSWQMAPGASKKSRLSIFGLFANGAQVSTAGNTTSDSTRGSLDIPSAENIYVSHFSHLQPHSQNPMTVTFSTGRRSSSSSILRGNTAAGSSHSMSNGSLGLTEGGLPALAMSRRMSSGGVGEVCLARICVSCERELLKPVPRCTSIAKYYGSLNNRGGYRPPPHGYSSLGPYMGRQHAGPLHPMDREADPTITGNDYNPNGVRRHSPLRQVNHMANVLTHEGPTNGGSGYYNGGAGVGQGHNHGHGRDQGTNAGWNPREEPVGPHGEARCHPSVLTFQEQQLQYTQQTLGPLSRELC
ncbi:hypothetical protein BGX27_001988 [Mortierella sp. AM989]|nr:hypothetical protein BGX27_001988 [Mortierella sp. AM989]